MKCTKFALALALGVSAAGSAHAGLVLEFFVGTSQNDSTLSFVPFPNNPLTGHPMVTLGSPGQSAFVQLALHQTGSTNVLNANDGLAAYLIQGVFGPNGAAGIGPDPAYRVPATLAGGTTPVCNVSDPGTYSLVRAYRTGPNGSMSGGNENTATAFRFGGLNLNPPPSPSVDANGYFFLGTFRLTATTSSGFTSIVFQDPNPAPGTIDNITDSGIDLDAILFGGNMYPLTICAPTLAGCPTPEPSSFVLLGLIATGAVGVRLRRRKAAATNEE